MEEGEQIIVDNEQEAQKSTQQKIVDTTQKTVKTAKTTAVVAGKIQTLLATLLMPQTWIAILVTLAIVFGTLVFFATVQVIGRTENADGCYGIGSTSIQVQTSEDKAENINTLIAWAETEKFDFLGGRPMPRISAIGIGANSIIESGGGDPASVQPMQSHPEWTNEDVLKLGDVNGRAVGMLQWDGPRRVALVKYAQSKGKQWNDLSLQLEYLKYELDEGGEGARLAAAGWGSDSGTAAEKAKTWNKVFERSNDTTNHRQIEAEKLEKTYKGGNYVASSGGSKGGSGGSCLAGGSTSIDTSDVAKLAHSLAYPLGSNEDNVSASDPYGKTNAKQEYKDAKQKAEDETSPDPMPGLYASCDRFVATVIRLTVDKDIPWGSTTEQGDHLASSKKWQQFSKLSEAKAGDIFVTKSNGHIMLFLGEVDGQTLVAHASYMDRVAGLDIANQVISENLVDNAGRPYWGYHYVGD